MKLSMDFSLKCACICAFSLIADAGLVAENENTSVDGFHEPMSWVLRGLENNFALEIDRGALMNSQDQIDVSLGAFVTRFVAEARYSSSDR